MLWCLFKLRCFQVSAHIHWLPWDSTHRAWRIAAQAAGPRLTMTQKEKALEEFAEDGWLAAVPGRPGTYSLGVSAHPACLLLTLCCRHSLPAGAA